MTYVRLAVLVVLVFAAGAGAQPAPALAVAAASDLQSVLPALASRFERETSRRVTLTFGSSGNFFSQIQNGAPFDLFFSADVDYPQERVREESGLLDGVSEIGSDSVPQRLWAKPAITVIGIDTTPIASSSNTLIPRARAKVSLRVAPGGDARAHLEALTRHLETLAPWGAQVTVTPSWRMIANRGVTPDPGVAAEVARYTAALDKELGQPLGQTQTALNSQTGEVRTRETTMGNLIADALRGALNLLLFEFALKQPVAARARCRRGGCAVACVRVSCRSC
jgi:acetylornithine deacetylase/succinyl-diaminopimelate desuccinylase-like protein